MKKKVNAAAAAAAVATATATATATAAAAAKVTSTTVTKKYKKGHIPTALRQQVWLKHCGELYKHKCLTSWCKNIITVYDFHCGHNIPEVRGGKTVIDNLIPICMQCNLSMGCHYTFDEWCSNFNEQAKDNNPPIVHICCSWLCKWKTK